jgi:hypothetical protein
MVGRILAYHLKFKFINHTINHPDFMLHDLQDDIENNNYNSHNSPVQLIGGVEHPDFNILETINDKTPRKIMLDGFFQRKKFVVPFKDLIKKIYKFEKINTNKNDLAIHIRSGDLYIPNLSNNLLPIEYYEMAIEMTPHENITICTDDPEKPVSAHIIKKYNCKVFRGNERETITFLASHNNVILSQGSFSFWAGFFCDGDNIINAIPKTGWNSEANRNDIDLLIQENNYKYIKL